MESLRKWPVRKWIEGIPRFAADFISEEILLISSECVDSILARVDLITSSTSGNFVIDDLSKFVMLSPQFLLKSESFESIPKSSKIS